MTDTQSPVLEPESRRNPFVSIWLQPRKTMRQILETHAYKWVLPLAMVGGISQVFDKAVLKTSGYQFSTFQLLLIAFIAGPIGGLIQLYISGWIFYWVGKFLGGKAHDSGELRAALAWSNVPLIPELVIFLGTMPLLGQYWFTEIEPETLTDTLLLLVVGLVVFTLGIWSFVLQIKCVAEAHRFSSWRALATLILPFLVLIVPIVAIALLFAAGSGG